MREPNVLSFSRLRQSAGLLNTNNQGLTAKKATRESRVLKSIISHRGRSRFAPHEYPALIGEKDVATQRLYEELYSIRIGRDLSCFDLILDISPLIKEATLEPSLASIKATHEIIRPAAAWYLTGREEFRRQFEDVVAASPSGLSWQIGQSPISE